MTACCRASVQLVSRYYLIETDATSYAFIDGLPSAADSGVRFLLDDVFTVGYDAGRAGQTTSDERGRCRYERNSIFRSTRPRHARA